MPPPNGSDSERLMAQIEAYLRTGEGPPAAPEPASSPQGDRSPGGSGSRRRVKSGRRSRMWRRLRRLRRQSAARVRASRPWRALAGSRTKGGFSPGEVLHPSGSPGSGRAPSESPRWTVTRVVLVLGLLVGLLLVPVVWKKSSGGSNPDGADRASAAPAGPGYSFLMVNRSGTPVRWNPCQPIYYQLDLAAAPSWAEIDVGNAISAISTATGIQFVYEGPTNQFPTRQVPPGSGADEAPPVVIAWASPAQSRDLNLAVSTTAGPSGAASGSGAGAGAGAGAGSGAGSASPPGVDSLGRTVPVVADDQVTGHSVYVTGSVVLSSAAAGLPEGFGPGSAGVLLLHDLGRLVGLGDIADQRQVMNPDVLSTQVTGLGPGDRAGLKRLGRASGCLKVPTNTAIEPVL